MQPTKNEKYEKHFMWTLLDQKVMIDGQNQFVMNAIKIYTKSVLDAINDKDSAEIKFYSIV